MAQAAMAGKTVPELIEDLRQHIVRKTGKPLDPDVDFLTTQIEVLSATEPVVTNWLIYGLTPTESRFMDCLASKPGRVFSRDALMNALYFDKVETPAEKILDIFATKIRAKLKKSDAPCWIETIWGTGWRLRNDIKAKDGAVYGTMYGRLTR